MEKGNKDRKRNSQYNYHKFSVRNGEEEVMQTQKSLWFTATLAVVIIVCAMTSVVAAQERCNTYCKLFRNWSNEWVRNTNVMDRVDIKTAGEVYDEMAECFSTWMSDSPGLIDGRGNGWAFFPTSGRSKRLFSPLGMRNDDTIGIRKISDDLYVLYIGYGKIGSGVHILRRMKSDTVAIETSGVTTKQMVKYVITNNSQGLDENVIQRALDKFNSKNLYSDLVARGKVDSVSMILAKKFDLDVKPHQPFTSPDDCHILKEMSLGDDLFADFDGLQVGNVLVGNWLMVRFAGSTNLHFIYVGQPTAFTSKR